MIEKYRCAFCGKNLKKDDDFSTISIISAIIDEKVGGICGYIGHHIDNHSGHVFALHTKCHKNAIIDGKMEFINKEKEMDFKLTLD